MRKSSEISDKIEFETSADGAKVAKRYPFDIDGIKDEVLRLYDLSFDALKIITIALCTEDSDFFAEFSNLGQFYRIFEIFGINTGDFKPSAENFASNPIREWIGLISILFVTIESMPNGGGVYGERILYNGTTSSYLSLTVDTETVDYRSHVLGLMLKDGESVVMVDNVAMMHYKEP